MAKFLANADRWGDESALGRDVIDLAFMAAKWGREPLRAGLETATLRMVAAGRW